MNQFEKREFKASVQAWAQTLDVQVRSISVRSMARKWASCSSAGNMVFTSELLEMRSELQSYVIVHELLHFRVPNHGRLWKSLMRAHLGDVETLELELKEAAARLRLPQLTLQ